MNHKKILIAGTFDILHLGHLFLINEAAKLGDVHVIIATDKNRERFSGSPPVIPEQQRLEVILNLRNVKSARLGSRDEDILSVVGNIKPDIIFLGPDQGFDEKLLQEALKIKGLDNVEVRRLKRKYEKYELNSSSLIKRKIIESFMEDKMQKREKIDYPIP